MALGFVALALLAGVGLAAANIIDKVLLTDHLSSPGVRVFWYGLWAPVLALPAFLFGAGIPPLKQAFFPMLAGAFFLGGTVFLMEAFQRGKVSRLALMLQSNVLLTVLLSIVLLGEILAIQQYLGVGIIVIAAFLAALNHPEKGLPEYRWNKALLLTLAAAVLYAGSPVAMKFSLGFLGPWDVFYWQQIGMAVVAPLLLLNADVRVEAREVLNTSRRTGLLLILASSVAFTWATLTITWAASKAPISLVAPVITINPLFALVFIAILQRIGFEQFEEQLSTLEVLVKVLAAVLFAVGVYLVK